MAGDVVDINEEGAVVNGCVPFTERGIQAILNRGRIAPVGTRGVRHGLLAPEIGHLAREPVYRGRRARTPIRHVAAAVKLAAAETGSISDALDGRRARRLTWATAAELGPAAPGPAGPA